MGDASAVWGQLQPALDEILATAMVHGSDPRKCLTTRAFSQLYSLVYNACTSSPGNSMADQLYKRVGQTIDGFCRERLAPRLRGVPPGSLVVQVVEWWNTFKSVLQPVSGIFSYINRHYCSALGLPTINEGGFNSFRMLVLETVVDDLSSFILASIQTAREVGSAPNAQQLQAVVKMLVEVGSGKLLHYERNVEKPYLTQFRSYIRAEKAKLQGADEPKELLHIIEREQELARQCLHPTTEPKIAQVISQWH